MKHLSTLRKRNQRDSLSSGERTGNSLNLMHVKAFGRCAGGVAGLLGLPKQFKRVTNLHVSRTVWKNWPKKVIAL